MGEAVQGAQIPGAYGLAQHQQGHVLSGVVGGGGVAGVAAVVGSDHHQILLPQGGKESAQPGVKFIQGLGVAHSIPAVAVEHVKVHQIHKAQAMEVPGGIILGVVQAVQIALIVDVLRVAPAGEDIMDLAHRQGVQPRPGNGIQHGFGRRLQGEVMAVGGTAEGFGGGAHIGPGNDPSHAVLPGENRPGLAAGVIQLLQRDQLLLSRHLEDGVGGGIDDPLSGFQLLLAVVPDHLRAGIGQIAQPAPAGLAFKFLQNLLWEALGIGGQRLGGHHAADLPVADGGVLAHGGLPEPGHRTGGGIRLRQAVHAVDAAKARSDHMGDVENAGGLAGAQGVHPHVPELLRIGHGADAEGIQYN